jgi:hypothetical protein
MRWVVMDTDQKIFCIGLNKTGTTSLERALRDLGFRMGSQAVGEHLLRNYVRREFSPILDFCNTAEAFQDIPFSLPYTYVVLRHTFPAAKFILSVRNSPDQWFQSLISYMAEWFDGRLPTVHDLQECTYRYKGWMWEAQYASVQLPDDQPFHRETWINFYTSYNQQAEFFFQGAENFLKINLANDPDYGLMCDFLGKCPVASTFPHLNRSGVASS